MKYALINGGVVQALETDPSEERIQELSRQYELLFDITEYPGDVQAGWVLTNGALYSPPSNTGAVPTADSKITRLAFRNRFTQAERVTLYGLAAQNNTTGYAFKDYLDQLNNATFVDLKRADTIGSVQYLASLGIITSQRASEILNNPVQSHEVYK